MKWMNGSEMLKNIAEETKLIKDVITSENVKSLGYSTMANGMLVKPIVSASNKAQIIQFPNMSASEALAVGGAATGGAAATGANFTVINGGAGAGAATSSAGILSAAVPVVVSCLAAVGGYLIGNELYEHNSEFFDELTGPLMEKFVDGTNNLMVLLDSDGNTYIDKEAYEILLNKLNSYPDILTESIIQNGTDMSSYKPTCKLADAMIETLKNNIELGLEKNAQKDNYSVETVFAGLRLCCDFVESLFPNDILMCQYNTSTSYEHSNYYDIQVTRFFNIGDYTYEYYEHNGVQYPRLVLAANYQKFSITASPNSYGYLIGTVIDPYKVTSGSLDTNIYYCTYNYDGSQVTSDEYYNRYNDFRLTIVPGGSVSGNYMFTSNPSLPNGVTKFTPKITSGLKEINLLKYDTDGNQVEVPYVPVRIPSKPSVVPVINPDDDPTKNPDNEPDRYTPYIPTEVPYPSNVPKVEIKPLPTPEENPNNLPTELPNLSPSTSIEPAIEPNPVNDPSSVPKPITNPNSIPVNDPVANPESSGTTPSLPIPTIPTISSNATGLLHVYNPTNAQINEFGTWLWTTFSGDLIDTISKLFNNPMDGVIGVHELYVTPSTSSESTIKCGFLDSGVTSRLVNKRYTEINCGSIIVPEHWGNYLDYAPYTKAHCYLPFIGMVELNADDIVGHAVNITYKIDAYTGACIAVITVASSGYESICYQFPGNCAVEVPITSGMKSVLQSALIGAATTAIGAAVGGAAGAALGGASAGAIASTAAIRGGAGAITGAAYGARAKNDVQHSGSFGSSFGAMGCKKPFLVIKRPKQKVVAGYNKNYGYPAHKMVTIGSCSGYLRAREVDVVSVTATEDEKKLIEEALKSGVFVS